MAVSLVNSVSTGPSTPKPPPPRRPWRVGRWIAAALLLGLGYVGWQGHMAGRDRLVPGAQPLIKLPSDFLWGTATAGYQWEGGDTASNWAAWERRGRVRERSGRAADGWDRYREDLDLARDMGMNAFRFSIEWSRLEPTPGRWDPEAVAHYRDLLKACKDRGLTPIVTLLHYTYPAWVDRLGPAGAKGWESKAAIAPYERYVRFVAREFGPDIKYYLTFNEPTVLAEAGYLVGLWPPGKTNPAAFINAGRNLIAAHSRAYDAIHALDPDAEVSFNNYAAAYQFALDPSANAAPAPGDDWFLKAFANMLVPKRQDGADARALKLDFVAVDYYKRLSIPVQIIPPSPSDWHVYPEGFSQVLERYHKAFGLPILVAENGLATDNNRPREDGWTRERYLVEHIAQLQKARAAGVPVFGYTYWTLTDNWEWGSFDDRFGLYRVECRTGDYTRHPTPAVSVYRTIAQNGGVTPELLDRYAGETAPVAAPSPARRPPAPEKSP